MTRLSFPEVARPVASIVVPTYGSWEWTSRTLTALLERTDLPYELVVCDNASPDETPERLVALEGARVVLNDRNVGYAAACNQGAALSRAPYLVFLNSDAIPHVNWLAPLVESLERDAAVGAVGPRLLNLDGSLQEAGSTVLGDATTVRHGDGSAAEAAEFSFARVVDYVSGACLATRRSTFHRAGGFDVAFGWGYFEDVDFCFRLRALGHRIQYEPRSVLTHVRGASTSDDLKQVIFGPNQRLFHGRWKHMLAGRPTTSESDVPGPILRRDLAATDRILLVAGMRESRAHALLDDLLAIAPGAAVTLLGRTPSAPRHSGLVEHASPEDEASWLRQRRYVYDTVILLDLVGAGRLLPALNEAQPQALVVADVGAGDWPDAPVAMLDRVDMVLCASVEDLQRMRREAPDTPAFGVAADGDSPHESRVALTNMLAATGAAVSP